MAAQVIAVLVLTVLAAVVAAAAVGEDLPDTVMVGSSVHAQTVAPPADLGAAASGDKGYRHSHQTKGGDGYKHFDSFHKKDGDSFGYEKHSKFGKGDHGGDGGEYHESSSYNSDDDGNSGGGGGSGSGHSGSQHKPKVISYHYESQSGTPRDYSNYDPETYEGDYTSLAPQALPQRPAPRRAHPDVQLTGPQGLEGEQYQSLYDVSGENPPNKKVKRQRGKGKELQTAGTEEDAEYDYYDGEEEGDGEGEYYTEGGDYEGEGGGEGEADYYY